MYFALMGLFHESSPHPSFFNFQKYCCPLSFLRLRKESSDKADYDAGGTVKSNGLQSTEQRAAAMIDRARAVTFSAHARVAQKGERLLSKTIGYMRDELFPALNGK